MMDREAEVAQLRKVDFRTGGNGPAELYDMADTVLKVVGLDDPTIIKREQFTLAIVALELAIIKGVANKASSLEHFAGGMEIVIKHLNEKSKEVIMSALAGAL